MGGKGRRTSCWKLRLRGRGMSRKVFFLKLIFMVSVVQSFKRKDDLTVQLKDMEAFLL